MSRKIIATPTVPAGAKAEWARLRAGIAALPVAVPCAGPERPFWHSTDVAEQAAAARACLKCPLLHRCDDYATAAVDRLLHHAHVITTEGTSMRLTEATTGHGVVPLN